MGNQYSYPEAKANQDNLKNEVKNIATQMKSIHNVVSNFMNVEGFGGQTEQQIKAFMREVVLGGIEASNLLIENVELQHQNIINRFQGIDGADDTIIYETRLKHASDENNAYAKVLEDKTDEINTLIDQAIRQGVEGKKCDKGQIGTYKTIINNKIETLAKT